MVVSAVVNSELPAPALAGTDGLQGKALLQAMCCIIFGLVLCVMDSTMLNLALPLMARQWQVDPALTLWVVNANQIAALVMLLPLAALGERLGYKRVYLWGMGLFGITGWVSMWAPSLEWLIVGRTLQGLGMAGALSVNAALVRQIYPRALLGKGMALNSMMVALTTVTGPVLSAAVLSLWDWRWLFVLHVPLTLALCAWGRKSLPGPREDRPQGKLSLWDVALNIVVFASLFLCVDRLSHSGGDNWQPAAAWLVLGLGAGVVYVWRQRRQAEPMLPLDLLRIEAFRLSMGASVCAFAAQTLAFLSLPFLLMGAHGLSTGQVGMLISAWPLALALTSPWVGRCIGRVPASKLGGVGMLVFTAGVWALAAMPHNAADWNVAWRLALCGMGFALFQSPNNHTIVTASPLHRSAAASGMLGTARHIGQGLGAVALAGIFVLWPGHLGAAEQRALWLAGGCALLAGVFSVLRYTPVKKP